MRRVLRIVQDQRDGRYSLLRGYFHGADDNTVDERQQERLSTFTLAQSGKSRAEPLSSFGLSDLGVRVLSLRRADGRIAGLNDAVVLEVGDTLVLSGKAEALSLAEQRLTKD
jgi:CPA2 family monovalent cation:H+ antiporter-2